MRSMIWMAIASATLVLAGCGDRATRFTDLGPYYEAMEQAQKLDTPLARCLAAPDLPNSEWPARSAEALCHVETADYARTLAELDGMLKARGGGKAVDALFAKVDASRPFAAEDAGLQVMYGLFRDDALARRVVARWLEQSPVSSYAHAAAGYNALQAALTARGDAFVTQTSPTQIAGMNRGLDSADTSLRRALVLNPELGPACIGLMISGRHRDSGAFEEGLKTCRRQKSRGFYFYEQLALRAEPKWGGTMKMNQVISEWAEKDAEHNPALAAYRAYTIGHPAELMAEAGKWRTARKPLAEVAAVGPYPKWLGRAGVAAREAGDLEAAEVYLTQAIRFRPDSRIYREQRASVYKGQGRPGKAITDLEHLVSTGEANGWSLATLGELYEETGQHPKASAVYLDAARQGGKHASWAWVRRCGLITEKLKDREGGLQCTADAASAMPKDAQVAFMRAYVLTQNRRPEATAMVKRFRSLINTRDPHHVDMLKRLEKLAGRT